MQIAKNTRLEWLINTEVVFLINPKNWKFIEFRMEFCVLVNNNIFSKLADCDNLGTEKIE